MMTPSEIPGTSDALELNEVNSLIATGLAPIVPPKKRQNELFARLMDRVAHSATRHANLLTLRRRDGQWHGLPAGVRVKHLWKGPFGNSVLIEFAPGAILPMHRQVWVEEGIVLRGGLQMGGLDLGPFDYHISPAGSRHGCIRSRQGALAYLRGTSLGHMSSVIRELLLGLLPYSGEPARTVFATEGNWEAIGPGVYKKELWNDGAFASRYYRLEPGPRVAGHDHSRDEECMMLSGELFLGDILLRPGEYQLAPEGSMHGEVFSDVGALLFVRGPVR